MESDREWWDEQFGVQMGAARVGNVGRERVHAMNNGEQWQQATRRLCLVTPPQQLVLNDLTPPQKCNQCTPRRRHADEVSIQQLIGFSAAVGRLRAQVKEVLKRSARFSIGGEGREGMT